MSLIPIPTFLGRIPVIVRLRRLEKSLLDCLVTTKPPRFVMPRIHPMKIHFAPTMVPVSPMSTKMEHISAVNVLTITPER